MEASSTISSTQTSTVNFFRKVHESKWLDIALIVSAHAIVIITFATNFESFSSLLNIQSKYLAIGMYVTAGVFAITVLVRPFFGLPIDGCWVKHHSTALPDEPLSRLEKPLSAKEIACLKNGAKEYSKSLSSKTNRALTPGTEDLERGLVLQIINGKIASTQFTRDPINYMRMWQKEQRLSTTQLAWEFIYDELSKIREIPPDIIR